MDQVSVFVLRGVVFRVGSRRVRERDEVFKLDEAVAVLEIGRGILPGQVTQIRGFGSFEKLHLRISPARGHFSRRFVDVCQRSDWVWSRVPRDRREAVDVIRELFLPVYERSFDGFRNKLGDAK